MANAISAQIRALTLEKIDFQNDEAQDNIKSLTEATLNLDDSADAFVALAGEDADQAEIAVALVDLADLFDDVNLSPSQRIKLDSVVNGLLKSGSQEQKDAAKALFAGTLEYGIAAKTVNAYFDTLLATDPA